MDIHLKQKLLSLLGYKNSLQWVANNHSKQIANKRKHIAELEEEVQTHAKLARDANATIFDINKAMEKGLRTIPNDRLLEVMEYLHNASENDVEDAMEDHRPNDLLADSQFNDKI